LQAFNASQSLELPNNWSNPMTPQMPQQVIPLEQETRFTVETASAAFHLNRRPQTMRSWACFENGPIRPIRIHGRLAWRVSDIRTMLGCSPFPKPAKPDLNEASLSSDSISKITHPTNLPNGNTEKTS
jgi:hypothetical protein